VPPRRPDQLATTLAALLDDVDRRQALGRAGAERARARYSWARVARSTLDVYRAVATPDLVGSGEVYR
ncbi:MAG TPA: glycosyltransferase, partial [Acidimicrobiales bacterium]|nr:glycosyltransferase [Acidimicrobiales bacterium]